MMRFRRVARTILLLSAIAATFAAAKPLPAPPGTVQSYDGYKSWLAACDNALDCVTKGFSDAHPGAEIVIDRDAGPSGKLVMSIRADRAFALGDVRIDGKLAGLAGSVWQLEVSTDESTLSTNNLAAIRQLVARLRNATKVTLGGDAEVSLDGFAAAVLRMDERQGRIGGVTALIRTGPLPASRVPRPPALPKIPNHPISATLADGEQKRLIAAVRADQKAVFAEKDCEFDLSIDPEAHALDNEQALVIIPCIMGAYQGSALGYIAPRLAETRSGWCCRPPISEMMRSELTSPI